MLSKKFFTNIFYAFGAQIISLVLSFVLSLLVPKMIGVKGFGYWQLFVFYSSYITFFHFGLNDGVYLENGGKSRKELNLSEIKSMFVFGIIMESFISLIIIFLVQFTDMQLDRKFVIIQTTINFILFCATNYLGYVFQAINDTKTFSVSVIINKILFIIFLMGAMILKIRDYQIIIYGFNIAQFLSLAYCFLKSKDILNSSFLSIEMTIKSVLRTMNIGSKLMIANIASMLILGVSRFFVDKAWGIEIFSKFSFALTLVNFFLLFINQFSMVMFPALRKIDTKEQKRYYINLSVILDLVLPGFLLCYFPIKLVLGIWLPEYSDSLYYFGFLLPLCSSNGKMQMVNSTYLKVLRKEKKLLEINIITVVISMLLTLLSVYVLKSMLLLLLSLVATTWFRNFLSERYLRLYFKINNSGFIQDAILIVIYLVLISFSPINISFFSYLIIYIVFLFIKRTEIKKITQMVKQKEF